MRPFAAVVYRGTWLSGWWCNEPITDVVRRLNLSADGEAGMNLLARSAVTQARQRVGAAPVEWLFRQTAQTGARNDKPELREYYGSANTSTKRQNAYPVMRLVALMNLGSHILLNAVTAPYRQSETVLAHSMLATIPDNSITLFDKLFYSEDLLLTLNQKGCNRHWLLPAWKNIASEMIELGNTASPGTIPKRLEHLRGALEVVFITKRPRPSRPRSVKISKTRYPVKHSAAPLK